MVSAEAAYLRFMQGCIQFSSIALLYYDYALTFPDEVKYMWLKPFRLTTVLYICCRYALVANVLYLLAQTGKLHSSCNRWYKFDGVISVFGRAAVIAALTLRTYAVFRGNRRIFYILGPIGLMCVILDIMHVPGLRCNGSSENETAAGILSIAMVVFEWIAAILTSAGCIMAVRVNGNWRWDSATLYVLLFRQGLIYFGFASLFTVTAVTLNFTATKDPLIQDLPNALNLPISCLLTARLLLQIRALQGPTQRATNASEARSLSTFHATRSSVRFAATILDDFGDDELATMGPMRNEDTETRVEDENEPAKLRDSDVEVAQVEPHSQSATASPHASIHHASSQDEEPMIEG